MIETELALPDITDRKEVVVSGTELSDIPAKKCGGAALQYDQKTALLWWMGGGVNSAFHSDLKQLTTQVSIAWIVGKYEIEIGLCFKDEGRRKKEEMRKFSWDGS